MKINHSVYQGQHIIAFTERHIALKLNKITTILRLRKFGLLQNTKLNKAEVANWSTKP